MPIATFHTRTLGNDENLKNGGHSFSEFIICKWPRQIAASLNRVIEVLVNSIRDYRHANAVANQWSPTVAIESQHSGTNERETLRTEYDFRCSDLFSANRKKLHHFE